MSEDTTTIEPTAVEAPGHVVASIQKFVSRESGEATAVIQPIGAAGVRITLVGADGGILGDRVVADVATAEAVVNAVDGLSIGEWDRALVSSTTVKPSHYRKMAGWVARQTRFPKPRNRASL
ncbi:hypothetical protein HH308_25530 [Gordonia sp. TBRC 11910]|uniref:Uncharacterized protein n=1 Tax=Gordonia asplenii TaxID=2725283 RepID=A0A848L286_9ACTN|nr:hypothetical protein [Gordonia asplenii]NMO04587.1 hypothetical protein [Gordonia asplenii]